MHVPSKRREEFEEARYYEYPEHLRPAMAALPSCPGVYIFHGEDGDLPLYIGKSVNLRSRVLSHLRNTDEARMLRQARSISYIRTAGEIGALLLEARLIKERHPLYNQKLRRNRQLCSLRVAGNAAGGMPEVVYSKDIDFATEPDLYGLFGSRHAALEGLRSLADQHGLCYGALGLEKLSPGRGCFRSMLHQCAGVCKGSETVAEHRRRLFTGLEELRVSTWPFAGGVGLVERWQDADQSEMQIHVIRNWHYLGSASSAEEARGLNRVAAGFDADGYKILAKPILTCSVEIIPL